MSYEKLYRAQVAEHEKITERLRIVEKENANLRSLLQDERIHARVCADKVKTALKWLEAEPARVTISNVQEPL